MEETRKKEEEKAKRWEEKARKDEERRAREVEKEERKKLKEGQAKVREVERQKKLEEKQKAEEEKDKKARVCLYKRHERTISVALTSPQSQLRLNAFLVQPSMPNATSRASPSRNTASPLSSRRSSIGEIKEMEGSRERSPSLFLTPQRVQPSDYERHFPPFFLQSHTVLAPQTRFSRDGKGIEYAQKSIDEGLDQGRATIESFNAYEMLHLSPNSGQRFPQGHAVKNIVSKIHGSARIPIDLTESQSRMAIQKPTDLLKTVPMKYLKFFEDYRPPYTGTFTKLQDRRAMSKLCRRPFSRQLPNTNYDYDSEAEWEDPGEGEDLDSEGEEEAGEDEDENDMEGFLDDDEGNAVKKRPLLGKLEPACSGICWEDLESENFQLGNLEVLDPSLFKLDILMGKTHITLYALERLRLISIDNPQLPIDPYSTSYWKTHVSTNPANATPQIYGSLMEPPRIPLNPINRQNTLLNPSAAAFKGQTAQLDASNPMKATKCPKRLIPIELLEEFKQAVNGNEFTKVGLLEVLKKQ